MALAEFHEVVAVDKEAMWGAVIGYDAYPSFVEGCSSVKVERSSPTKCRVFYAVEMMGQQMTYTLDHEEFPKEGKVRWHLVDSNFFKKNDGEWELITKSAGKTDVRYTLDVEFKVPVPSFILNRLVKGSLPAMVKGFAAQANKK